MKRIATALLAALAIMPVSLCAADLAEGEAIYLVLENISSQDGQAWLVEDTSGHKIIFRYIIVFFIFIIKNIFVFFFRNFFF